MDKGSTFPLVPRVEDQGLEMDDNKIFVGHLRKRDQFVRRAVVEFAVVGLMEGPVVRQEVGSNRTTDRNRRLAHCFRSGVVE